MNGRDEVIRAHRCWTALLAVTDGLFQDHGNYLRHGRHLNPVLAAAVTELLRRQLAVAEDGRLRLTAAGQRLLRELDARKHEFGQRDRNAPSFRTVQIDNGTLTAELLDHRLVRLRDNNTGSHVTAPLAELVTGLCALRPSGT